MTLKLKGTIANLAQAVETNCSDEAMFYAAFDADGTPSTPAIAVLAEEFRGRKSKVSHAAIWNGKTGPDEGASMSCHVSDAKVLPDTLSVRLGVPACYATTADLADVIKAIVATFNPIVVEVSPKGYFKKQVFDEEPGVGWMLYLPKILTVQQVPEARARSRQETNRHEHRRCRVLGVQP